MLKQLSISILAVVALFSLVASPVAKAQEDFLNFSFEQNPFSLSSFILPSLSFDENNETSTFTSYCTDVCANEETNYTTCEPFCGSSEFVGFMPFNEPEEKQVIDLDLVSGNYSKQTKNPQKKRNYCRVTRVSRLNGNSLTKKDYFYDDTFVVPHNESDRFTRDRKGKCSDWFGINTPTDLLWECQVGTISYHISGRKAIPDYNCKAENISK
jgi:hypothetical protein